MLLQLICHLVGDYVLQNQAMATEKVRSTLWAAVHATFYVLPFIVVGALYHHTADARLFPISVSAIAVMWLTHLIIDRHRLAQYWMKFWGIATFDSWCGRWIGYDASPRAFEKDSNQKRQPALGEWVIYQEKWYQVAEWRSSNRLALHPHGVRYLSVDAFVEVETSAVVRTRKRTVPDWLSVWLLILVDNTMHLIINWCALMFLVC